MPRKTKQEIIDEQQAKIEELEGKLQELKQKVADLESEKESLQAKIKTNRRKHNERNAGRKKDLELEQEYYEIAKEILRLRDLGMSNKQMLEDGVIKKFNPKTNKSEPISKAKFYRCLRIYEEKESKENE